MHGVLVLHGFTSSLDTVRPLLARLEAARIPYEVPLLRGHGTHPQDLEGVQWEDWVGDATTALKHLTSRGRQAIVVGHSMGGLLALDMAATYPARVAACVSASTCLRFRDPVVYALPLLQLMLPYWNSAPAHYVDAGAAHTHSNYRRFPVAAFAQVYRYSHLVRERLDMVTCPLLILQSSLDQTVKPLSAAYIYREVSSLDKAVVWLHGSGHEIFRDAQRELVLDKTLAFINHHQVHGPGGKTS